MALPKCISAWISPSTGFTVTVKAEEPGKKVVDELIARGIAVDERPAGPVIVRIDDLLGLKKEKYRCSGDPALG